jgi:hypothetical protein
MNRSAFRSDLSAVNASGPLKRLLSDWVRLGLLFNVAPTDETPDLENLLVRTAAAMPEHARLLPMVLTWLTRYGTLTCRHRLSRLAARQEAESSAALGMLLQMAAEASNTGHFNVVVQHCRPLPSPRPMFQADRTSKALAAIARDQASPVSLKWGLWTSEPQCKPDAIRPADWLMAVNPALHYRAVFAGNLRSSILACLRHEPSTGQSEAGMARACGVTPRALRQALEHLELCGLIRRCRRGRRTRLVLTTELAA